MIDQITFSIVIPSYNRGNLIGKTIESVLRQPFQSIQLIIVDDGSTDDTSRVVGSFQDQRIEYLKIENSERGVARNIGLRKAKGLYVNYFDSDDLYLPCLSELYSSIKQHNFPEVIFGSINHVDSSGVELQADGLPYKSFTKNLLYNNFLACGSVFLKREVANNFLFNEDRRLSSAEDWDLWLRIHSHYTFREFPGNIFQQVHHQSRSLHTILPEKIEIRDNYFAEIISSNKSLKAFYGNASMNLFIADRYTFIALAWSDSNGIKAFNYLVKSLSKSFLILSRKRFWAVLKKI